MNRFTRSSIRLLAIAALVVGLPFVAQAQDSIDPSTFETTLGVGESVTITKTITIGQDVTGATVDVFFLTDSTGSMGGLINSVKAAASDILTTTSGLGDVAFGVGEYRDIFDSFTYRTNTALTTDTAAVQAGINAWFAGGGGDFPEANMFGLEEVATSTAWRDDSTRILVWFGDAPGHDPRAGSTEASATAALVAENIVVQAIDVGSLDSTGQATRIAAATDGGVNSSAGDIADIIEDAIMDVFANYNEVALLPLGNLPGVGVDTCDPIIGDFDRSVERTFECEVTFTGLEEGVHEFDIAATVDGGIVARERDRITVRGDGVIPEPTAGLLFGVGALVIGMANRRRH